MEFSTYNVSYLDSAGIKRRTTITALSILDARNTVQNQIKIDNNRFFDGKLLKVWKQQPSSPKQKLAQSYGFLMGSIKGAQKTFSHVRGLLPNGLDAQKANRAIALVDSQFSKLQRDISDVFKLAGLKIK